MPLTPLKHIPEPILWHEGMLLTPEHFDELTARQEELLQHHVSSQPFNWGIAHVLFDEAQLLQGRITLLELDALMPDGFFLWMDREAVHPEVDLESLDPIFKQAPWLLYLTTPVQESNQGRRLRYASTDDEQEVHGDSAPDGDEARMPIPRMRPKFQLIPSRAPLSARYVSMPVASIGFRNGVWTLMEDYLPPVRRVEEASLLGKRCAALLRRVREFAVATHARWRGMSARERTESHGTELNILRSASAALPACEAMLSSQAVHPFALYLCFCSLAGHLAGVAEQIPPVFPAYKHDGILASFAEVERYIYGVLDAADTSQYAGFPFEFSDGVFSLNFAAEWFGRPMVLALRGQKGNDAALIAWGEQALIGARRTQAGMRGRRVLGAQRSSMEGAHELFAGADAVLFALEENREYLLPDEPLEISSGPASGSGGMPLGITLYVLQGAGNARQQRTP